MQTFKAGGNLRTRRGQAHRSAVRESFCGGNDVRRHFPLLNSKPAFAGTSPAGLHFVGDKQAAIILYDLENDLEILLWRRNESAHALNWFGQERRNLP